MISITNAAKEPHITPLQDSMWHRGMAGIDSCVFNFFENFAAEVSSNNSVKIRSGIGMIQGRYFCVEPSTYDEVTIANGTQGEKRKDLIVCRWTVDEEQKVQSGDWVVIQGTPTTGTPAVPSYTAGDLDAGDLIADMPFYEVTLDGINVTGVGKKFTSLGGIGKFPNPLPISKGGTGATTSAAALAALGGMQIKKVWTNPIPESDFPEQTIELNVTDASFILVVFKITKSSNLWKVAILTCDGNTYFMDAPYNTDYASAGTTIGTAFRGAICQSDGIQFGKGYSKDHSDKNPIERPSFIIPVKIFAVKGAI